MKRKFNVTEQKGCPGSNPPEGAVVAIPVWRSSSCWAGLESWDVLVILPRQATSAFVSEFLGSTTFSFLEPGIRWWSSWRTRQSVCVGGPVDRCAQERGTIASRQLGLIHVLPYTVYVVEFGGPDIFCLLYFSPGHPTE